MTTILISFLFISALLSLLVNADHQAADAAEAVRIRRDDL